MYFGAAGLSPETMTAFMAMNAGMTQPSDPTGVATKELGEAKNRSTFGSVSYPLSGVSVQEYDDAPRAMKASLSMMEAISPGSGAAAGFLKAKPDIKAAAQKLHDVEWTSYKMVWDFDKLAEQMPAGGDEMKGYMKKLFGSEVNGWMGVSGNRVIQVQAKDWGTAKTMLDSFFTSQNMIGDSAAFKAARKELPAAVTMIYMFDLGPTAFAMADAFVPMLKAIGLPFAMPEKLTPITFTSAFAGAGMTLQPQQFSFDAFVSSPAMAEVSKIVNQFLMGAN